LFVRWACTNESGELYRLLRKRHRGAPNPSVSIYKFTLRLQTVPAGELETGLRVIPPETAGTTRSNGLSGYGDSGPDTLDIELHFPFVLPEFFGTWMERGDDIGRPGVQAHFLEGLLLAVHVLEAGVSVYNLQ